MPKKKTQNRFYSDKDYQKGLLSQAEIAINFSVPEAAVSNIKLALKIKIPVVCGTTGWFDKMTEIGKVCLENDSAFLHASNFSIGVNIFFKVNKYLTKIMHKHGSNYKASINEIHHTKKIRFTKRNCNKIS